MPIRRKSSIYKKYYENHKSEIIKKTLKAMEIANSRNPGFLIDAEYQGDAAINPDANKRKIPDGAPIKGDANVLVFPNLTAANLTCHLLIQLSEMKMQLSMGMGLRKPVIILGRSNTAEGIETLITCCAMKANADEE